jgi:hypothetical protein
MRTIDTIFIHHSVTDKYNKDIWAESVDGRDYVPGFYIDGKEYKGNYHYMIYWDGEVKQPVPDDRYTYHCGVYNINLTSIAICFIGDYSNETPSKEALASAKKIIEELKEKYPITNIYGHKELYATACPGRWWNLNLIMEAEMTIPRESVDRAFLSIVKRHMTEDDYATYMNAKNEVEMLHLVANSIEHNEMYNDAVKYRKGDTSNDKYEKYNGDLYKKIS